MVHFAIGFVATLFICMPGATSMPGLFAAWMLFSFVSWFVARGARP